MKIRNMNLECLLKKTLTKNGYQDEHDRELPGTPHKIFRVSMSIKCRAFADPLAIQTVFEVRMKHTAVPNLSQLFCPKYRREKIHWMPFCVPWPGILLRERKKNFSTRQHLSLALWIPRIPVKSEKHQGFKLFQAPIVVTIFLLEIFNIGRG